MEFEVKNLLKELDLSEKERTIYLHLVKNKKLTAYQIAKQTKLHRSNCYNLLNKLINKGFVKEIIFNNKKFYSNRDLLNVLGEIKTKEAIILKIKSRIEQFSKKEETNINHLKTKNAFLQFDTKIYNLAKKNQINYFYMISNGPNLTTKSSKILIERLINESKRKINLKKIDARAIWDEKLKKNPFMKQFKKLGKNRFLPKLPNNATTFIYNNNVSFVFIENEEQIIEISNEKICEEMKAYFKYLWKQAK